MFDYIAVHEKMQEGVWYTAEDLCLPYRSMPAMVRRGLVEKRNTKPVTYRKLEASKYVRIIKYVEKEGKQLFTLFTRDNPIGMMCFIKNSGIMDCWGKPYDITNVNRLCFYHEDGIHTEYFLED